MTDAERIWMYDKKTGKTYHSLFKEVAQKPRFYHSDVESSLNLDVELPGTQAMKQLLQGYSLSDDEREQMSRYIATMIKRVPYHREYVKANLYPKLLANTAEVHRNKLRALRTRTDIPSDLIDQKLAETDAAEQKLLGQMPSKVLDIIEDPRPQTAALDVVSSRLASFSVAGANVFRAFALSHDGQSRVPTWGTRISIVFDTLSPRKSDASGRVADVLESR